jgi:hypothetical protein
MEGNCRSRHIMLWRSPESLPAPLRAQGERYGPGDTLVGAIQSFNLSPVIQNQSTGFSE